MEKDLGRIRKNDDTNIVVRVDDFGGRPGLTIREFVTNERYTGFTKSGTKIPAENFEKFKKMIDEINPSDFKVEEKEVQESISESKESSEGNSGVDDSGLM